ncbi:unnamed protein product [Caenorhabditis bovis]|uniref:DUF19 domain-containing protein n=1 Tax=Caenorhabditis bovis TaxID=2654633 RepID=A0A8S1EJR2_9PELO|nr:unnamed protein product [Caenorhabditis bovis]
MRRKIILSAFCSSPPQCVSKNFNICSLWFNQNLNETNSRSGWDSPADLSNSIRSYYSQGINGLLTVCSARQQFQSCLGSSYDVCISELSFLRNGQNLQDSKAYSAIFKMMEFDCDGGLLQSVRNWDCILATESSKNDELTACGDNFHKQLENAPSKLCQYSVEYENCARKFFAAACGAETSWWACERIRRGYSLDELCPSDTCKIDAPSQLLPKNQDADAIFSRTPKAAQVIQELVRMKRNF